MDLARGGRTIDMEKGGRTKDLERGGPTMDIERGGRTIDMEMGVPTMDIETGGQTVGMERGGRTMDMEKGGQTKDLERGGQTIDMEMGVPTMDIETGGQTVGMERGGRTMDIERGGQTVGMETGGRTIDLETSEVYHSVIRERGPIRQGTINPFTLDLNKQRRGAIFTNIFEDDAQNGTFYNMWASDTERAHTEDEISPGKREICRDRYKKTCKQMKVTPSSRVLGVFKAGSDVIDLRGIQLSSKGLQAACTALQEHTTSRRLELGSNCLQGNALSCVTHLMARNDRITELVLSENKLSGEGIRLLSNAVKQSSHLRHLDISGNMLSDADGASVADILKEGDCLRSLRLSHNKFHRAGLQIGEGIAANGWLENLDLSWNHLRGQGAEAVATGLRKNETLCVLDVSWNGFGLEGCMAMGDALEVNSTLHHLNMESNRIHPPALFELTKGLIKNQGLHTLKVGKNPITAKCATPFLSALSDAKDMTLTVLDINGVVVDNTFELILMELIEERPIQVHYERSLPLQRNKTGSSNRDRRSVVYNISPVQILYHFKKNMRNVDFFRMIDTDGSASLSRKEISDMLKNHGYPISAAGMDIIMNYLDTDKNGNIDLLEFSDGERRYKRRLLDKLQTVQGELEGKGDVAAAMTDIRNNPAPGGLASKYSSTFRSDLAQGTLPELT